VEVGIVHKRRVAKMESHNTYFNKGGTSELRLGYSLALYLHSCARTDCRPTCISNVKRVCTTTC